MIIVGVDPGEHGAVTILNTYKFRDVISIPIAKNTLSDIFIYLSEIRGGEPYARADRHYGRAAEVVPKEDELKNVYRKKLNTVTNRAPRVLSIGEDTQDNTMEMWLEEPGQIVVNSRTTITNGKRDSTGALLAGMMASRKLGRSIGQWEGIATALNISVNLLPPKRWQSRFNCPTRGDKNISKNCAIKAFPFLTDRNGSSSITHDIADSLLIALYGYVEYADVKFVPLSVKKVLGTS